MGWLENSVKDSDMSEEWRDSETDDLGLKFLNAMSFAPPLGRGVSWALDGSWMDMHEEVQ
jgi:hypothetical protein